MSSGLEFRINLSGNLASATEHVAKGLEHTGKAAHEAKEGVSVFEGEVGHLSTSLGGLQLNLAALSHGGSLFTFDLAEGLHAAFEIVEKLVDKFVELGREALGVAAHTQDINLAIKLNVGAEGAEGIEKLAEGFQRTTRFSAEQLKESILPLLKQGITAPAELGQIATIATDIAAREGKGIDSVRDTIGTFASIFQKGRLKPQALAQIGVQAKDYFGALAGTLGTSAEAAEKLAKKGKVSQDILINTAAQLVAKRQGGSIGGGSLAAGENLGATLERLKNVGERVFSGLADSPGIKAFQGSLNGIVEILTGDVGTRFGATIDHAFASLAAYLTPDRVRGFADAVIGTIEKIPGYINSVTGAFNTLWPVVRIAGEWFAAYKLGLLAYEAYTTIAALSTQGFAAAMGQLTLAILANPIGFIVGTLAAIGVAAYEVITHWDQVTAFFRGWWHDITEFFGVVVDGFKDFGTMAWQGFKEGISSGVDSVKKSVTGMADAAMNAITGGLGIESPSTVFHEFGGHTTEGFAQGIESGTARVGVATAGIADSTIGAAEAMGFGGGGGTTYHFGDIHVTAPAGADATEFAQEFRRELGRVLAEAA